MKKDISFTLNYAHKINTIIHVIHQDCARLNSNSSMSINKIIVIHTPMSHRVV